MTASTGATRRSSVARIVDVGVHHIDGGQQDQLLGALAPARGHAHEDLLRRQAAHDVPAQKPDAADDADTSDLHWKDPAECDPIGARDAAGDALTASLLVRQRLGSRPGRGAA